MDFVIVLIWLFAVFVGFLVPFIEHTNREHIMTQLRQHIEDRGGLYVSATPDSRRRFHYRVEYHDGKGYLYRAAV